jgi:hypothetical protein
MQNQQHRFHSYMPDRPCDDWSHDRPVLPTRWNLPRQFFYVRMYFLKFMNRFLFWTVTLILMRCLHCFDCDSFCILNLMPEESKHRQTETII